VNPKSVGEKCGWRSDSVSIDYLCFSKCELVRPKASVAPASPYSEAERACLAVSRIRQRSFGAIQVREPRSEVYIFWAAQRVVYD
jgi:hypothetical protein